MKICITRSGRNIYSETFIRNQIAGLSRHTQTCTIHSGRYPERDEEGRLLSPKPLWLIHKVIKMIVGRNNFFSDYGVKKYLKKNKVDLVWANYGMGGAHMVPACQALNIPLVTIFHGHDATDKKLLKQYRQKYQDLFCYARFIVVVSAEMRQRLINIGAPADKICLIPYGIDTRMFKPNLDVVKDKRFLAVGRFTAKKGPLYTIEAFYKVLQQHPEATLTMVGDKSGLFDECEALVRRLNIEKSVVFTGVLSQDAIAELMRSSLAFVQHSIIAPNGDMEGTPLGILEASASGLPVVATFHAGIKEAVVHESSGFLVEEKDADAMADYMIRLCNDPAKAKQMGLSGRAHIELHYEAEKQIGKWYATALDAVASDSHAPVMDCEACSR